MKNDLALMQFKRSLQEFMQSLNKPEPAPQSDLVTAQDKLTEAVLQAQQELGIITHAAAGFEPKVIGTKPAMSSITLHLGTDFAPLVPQTDSIERNINLVSNEAFTLQAVVAQAARTVQAGATLIVADEQYLGNTSGMHLFSAESALYRVIEAADFSTVTSGSDVSESALPFSDGAVSWRDETSHEAFRVKVSRRTRKNTGGETIEYDVLTAIIHGLAKAADRVLLQAIAALNPSAFTIGAAAARNITFAELSGFVGTTGTGATVQEGKLFAGGLVNAELTAGTDKTLIGAFNRVAVAIHPDVRVVIERMNAQSDLNIIVYANIQAVLPNVSKTAFWKVA